MTTAVFVCGVLFVGGGAKDIFMSAAIFSSGLQMMKITGIKVGGNVPVKKEPSAEQTKDSQPSDASYAYEQRQDPVSLPAERPTDAETGDIKTVSLETSAGNSSADGIHYNNTTGVDIDVPSLIAEGLPFTIEQSSEPQVLIYHTHGTEC